VFVGVHCKVDWIKLLWRAGKKLESFMEDKPADWNKK
jgi:hypothetical protein